MEASTSLNQELSLRGFCVMDGCFSREVLLAMQEEVVFLDDCHVLEPSPNSLQGLDGETFSLVKPHISERSLVLRGELAVGTATLGMVPHLKSLADSASELTSALKSSCSVLSSLTSLDQLKVAIIREKGAFAVHTDTHPSTGRTTSITLYLTEDYQQARDAGELRVFPFPYAHLDVAPLFGRMVIFSSCNLFHRVMPSTNVNARCCLSIMFYGADAQFPYQGSVGGPSLPYPDTQLCTLFQNRRMLTPLVYLSEFKRSMLEAFSGDGQARQLASAVSAFSSQCDKARALLSPSMQAVLATLPVAT